MQDHVTILSSLRNRLYHDRPSTRLEWARLFASSSDQVAKDYIVSHSPYDSAEQIEGAHDAWLEQLCADSASGSDVGDRPFQVFLLTKKGLTQREIARVLRVSRTRVREALAAARRRPRLARSLAANEAR